MLKRLSRLLLTVLLMASGLARAEELSDQYLRVFNMIDQADTLNSSGQAGPARAKYQEAQATLRSIKQRNPNWNATAVSYRLNYVAEKLALLSRPAPVPPADAAAPPGGINIKLLEAGAEPRKALRLHPVAGDKQTVNITAKMSMGTGETKSQMMQLPPMKLTVSVLVGDISPDGDINYMMTFDDVGVAEDAGTAPEMVAAMKSSLDGMKGLQIAGTMSNRGVSRKAEVMIPPGTDPEKRASMEQMKETVSNTDLLLPEEAIGPGAKWAVRQSEKSDGVTIDRTMTHQLVSIDGDILTVTSSIDERAANQKIPNPLMPGSKADLIKLTGSGNESLSIDLTRILPAQGTAHDHTEMTLGMVVSGQKKTMVTKQELEFEIQSK